MLLCAGCSDDAGWLGELEGGHDDCWESVVKTEKSWEGMVAVLGELGRKLKAIWEFSSTWEGRAEGGEFGVEMLFSLKD